MQEEKTRIILENIIKILKNSDAGTQCCKAVEELSELIRAITRCLSFTDSYNLTKDEGKELMDNLVEEIADVKIMLMQLMSIFRIDTNEVYDVMLAKTDRTLERLGCR